MAKDNPDNVRRESMDFYGFGPEAMKKTRVCTVCGTATTSDAPLCAVCGAALPKETLFTQYKQRHLCCPYCDAILESPSDYCPQCGRKLK